MLVFFANSSLVEFRHRSDITYSDIQVRYLDLFQVVLNGKSSQEHPINAGVPLKASFLVLLFSYDTLMTYTGTTTYADVIYSYLTH